MPISTTYPPTVDQLIAFYSYEIPTELADFKTKHYLTALDKIDILTSGRVRTEYDGLTDTNKDYVFKALARLFMYYFSLNQNFIRGSYSASQGANSVSQTFEYPQTIDPEVYNLLKLSGLYETPQTEQIGSNPHGFSNYNNPYLDATGQQPVSWSQARSTFLYGEHILSKDKSVIIDTFHDEQGVKYDLSAKASVSTDDLTISLNKDKKLQAIGLISTTDPTKHVDYDQFENAYSELDDAVRANTTDITTNKTAITKNTTDITTNTGGIANLQGQQTLNTNNIQTNTTNITTNKSDIGRNTANTTTNKTAITRINNDIVAKAEFEAGDNITLTKTGSSIGDNHIKISGVASTLKVVRTKIDITFTKSGDDLIVSNVITIPPNITVDNILHITYNGVNINYNPILILGPSYTTGLYSSSMLGWSPTSDVNTIKGYFYLKSKVFYIAGKVITTSLQPGQLTFITLE